MKQKSQLLTAFLVIGLALACTCAAAAAPTVYSLPIQGEIEPGLAVFVARGLALAERNDGVVLLEINTFGGRVDAATEIKDLIFRSKVPVIAYVSERAWSAGALIALAAPKIAMAPGSSMGAAERRRKILSEELRRGSGSGRDRVWPQMVDAIGGGSV